MTSENNNINFYQGGKKVRFKDNAEKYVENIKQKIAELSNIKNVSFLLGSGASADSIPTMKELEDSIKKKIGPSTENINKNTLYKDIFSCGKSLENALEILYAKRKYLLGVINASEQDINEVETLIADVEESIYEEINVSDCRAEKSLQIYKEFYQKIALRSKDLSRINIFTTNYDLLNEKALDALNIDYNNGFGGGLDRVFNPARFRYIFSRRIDENLEKFEPLENMVYLYKLHGSISWVEKEGEKEGRSLFDIHEVPVTGGAPKEGASKADKKHVLIYPTPSKQSQSLGAPYADIIREFQGKLSQPNSALFSLP